MDAVGVICFGNIYINNMFQWQYISLYFMCSNRKGMFTNRYFRGLCVLLLKPDTTSLKSLKIVLYWKLSPPSTYSQPYWELNSNSSAISDFPSWNLNFRGCSCWFSNWKLRYYMNFLRVEGYKERHVW